MALNPSDVVIALSLDVDTSSLDAINNAAKAINAEFEGMGKGLTKTLMSMNPEVLRKRVATERQVADVSRKYATAKRKEEVSQAGGPLQWMMGNIAGNMAGGGGSKGGQMMAALMGSMGGGGKGGGGSMLGTVGSMVGEAFGGEAGAVIGKAVAEAIPGQIAKPAEMAKQAFESVSNALKGLSGPLGAFGAGLNLLSDAGKAFSGVIKGIPLVGEVLGPMMDAFTAIPGIFADIVTQLVSFVQLGAPAVFENWNMALRDTIGVIGQSFTPVLKLMTEGIRLFADILATILPNMGEVDAALASVKEAWAEVRDALRDVIGVIGPIIKDILIGALKVFGEVIAMVARQVAAALRLLMMIPGFSLLTGIGSGGGMRSSFGAATQPAQIQDANAYQQAMIEAAYSQPPEVTAAEESRDFLQQILSIMQGFTLEGIASALARATVGAPMAAAGSAAAGAAAASVGIPLALMRLGNDLLGRPMDWLQGRE
jgi:hypothetical protein